MIILTWFRRCFTTEYWKNEFYLNLWLFWRFFPKSKNPELHCKNEVQCSTAQVQCSAVLTPFCTAAHPVSAPLAPCAPLGFGEKRLILEVFYDNMAFLTDFVSFLTKNLPMCTPWIWMHPLDFSLSYAPGLSMYQFWQFDQNSYKIGI